MRRIAAAFPARSASGIERTAESDEELALCLRRVCGELAKQIVEVCREFPVYRHLAEAAQIVTVDSGDYYGKYYQDIQSRVPSIKAAKDKLGWSPSTDLRTAIRRTLEYHVKRGDINFA